MPGAAAAAAAAVSSAGRRAAHSAWGTLQGWVRPLGRQATAAAGSGSSSSSRQAGAPPHTHTCEVLDQAGARLLVEALGVAALALLQRRLHVHLAGVGVEGGGGGWGRGEAGARPGRGRGEAGARQGRGAGPFSCSGGAAALRSDPAASQTASRFIARRGAGRPAAHLHELAGHHARAHRVPVALVGGDEGDERDDAAVCKQLGHLAHAPAW
jgi:hypothetical protein